MPKKSDPLDYQQEEIKRALETFKVPKHEQIIALQIQDFEFKKAGCYWQINYKDNQNNSGQSDLNYFDCVIEHLIAEGIVKEARLFNIMGYFADRAPSPYFNWTIVTSFIEEVTFIFFRFPLTEPKEVIVFCLNKKQLLQKAETAKQKEELLIREAAMHTGC